MIPLLRRAVYVGHRLMERRRFRQGGAVFEVAPGVVNPTVFRASRTFAREALALAPRQAATVLELGCGCGLASVLLARAGHRVTAVDVDPRAVENTRANASANGASVRALVSDWDKALPEHERFDFVVSNPPFLRVRPPAFELALYAGEGLERFHEASLALARRLAPSGRGLLLSSSRSGREDVLLGLAAAGLLSEAHRWIRGFPDALHLDLVRPA